jgi:hypothetical protein
MIFAKIDVSFPRHYRLLDVRPESVRIPLGIQSESERTHPDASARIARAAALGVWTAALCYTRDHMLDGFCPLSAIDSFAVDEVVDELVRQGLLVRAERDGREGVVIVNYAKHNETKAEIDRRLKVDRTRKGPDRRPRGIRADSERIPSGIQTDSSRIPPSESETESESELKRLPSQAPAAGSAGQRPGDHQELIAHFSAEFEQLKGVKPVIGAKGGAGAKKLLQGRTLAEAKAIVDRALADPWMLDKTPELTAIAARVNAFIGRRVRQPAGPQGLVQPATGSWKKADGAQ